MPLFVEVARQTILLQLRSKVFLALVVLSLLVAGAMFLVPSRSVHGDFLFQLVAYHGGVMTVIPFITLYLAVQAVHGDIEDRTSVHLFTRPISRSSLLFGKWFGASALAAVFASVAIGSVFLTISIKGDSWAGDSAAPVSDFLVMWAAGGLVAVGYASVGCLFAAFFRRPMLIAILFLVVEQFASRLPPEAGIHTATIAFPVRRLLFENMDVVWELQRELRGHQMSQVTDEQEALLIGSPLLWIGKTVLVVMLLAVWIYSRREYDSRPRE